MNHFKNKNTAGFTLIELLVVIAIIGVLSGVVLQSISSARQKSQNATRLSDIDQINKALELYLTNVGVGASLPSTGGNWRCIGASSCWGGTFTAQALATELLGNISKTPKDPFLVSVAGDYYVYSNSFASTAGTGAYLRWYVNDTGSTRDCGRGASVPPISGGYKLCELYLGK